MSSTLIGRSGHKEASAKHTTWHQPSCVCHDNAVMAHRIMINSALRMTPGWGSQLSGKIAQNGIKAAW